MKKRERKVTNAYLSVTNIEENPGGYSEEQILKTLYRYKRFLVEDFGLENAQVWIDRKDGAGFDDIWHLIKEDDFYAVDEDLTIEENCKERVKNLCDHFPLYENKLETSIK